MKVFLVVCAVLSLALVNMISSSPSVNVFLIRINSWIIQNYLQFANASSSYVDDEDIENFDIDTYATIAEKFQCIRVSILIISN